MSSFYFAVGSGTNVPLLSYDVAQGQVYQLSTTAPPLAGTFTPPNTFVPGTGLSDLRAFNPGDRTWEFLDGLSLVASSPPLTFGVGTVGNSDLDPNNFDGNIVDGKDFSIFVGSPQTANLAGELLVQDSITFQFGGLGSFTLDDIVPHAVFGFGTSPYVVAVPEPAGLSVLALGTAVGGLALLAARRRRSRSR